jgi:hypothetical protein
MMLDGRTEQDVAFSERVIGQGEIGRNQDECKYT